jgi:hypothetical protein
MTRTDDFTDLLETYLEEYEGSTPLPDAVRDTVIGALPSTRQHRLRWGPPRRTVLRMDAPLALALASAAVIVAAIVGIGLLQAPNIGGPDASAQPSPSPEAAPLSEWAGRPLAAGDYLVDEPFPVRLRMTVPEGFHGFGTSSHLAAICTNECELPDRSGVAFWVVTNVFTDPCGGADLAEPPIGPSVDDLVAALRELPRREATIPTDVSIDGSRGTYLELRADEDLDGCDPRGFRAWAAGTESRRSPPGDHDRLWILDVGGTRLVINVVTRPGVSADEVAALEAIVASIRFEPVRSPGS